MLSNIFSFFAQNPFAGLLAIGYFFLTFGDSEQRNNYFDRVFALLTDPTTLQKDKNYYSKQWFESVENGLKSFLLNNQTKSITESIGTTISNAKSNWKRLTGWLLLALFLLVFLIADLITIQNIAEVLNINLTINFPVIFYDYGLAITIGTFFTLIASGFVLFELYTNLGFTDYGEESYTNIRKTLKIGAWIIFISSLIVVIFLALKAWSVKSGFPENIDGFLENLAQFGVNVMVRFNAFLATALIFSEAIKVLSTIVVILAFPAYIFMGFLCLLSGFVSILIRFFLDLIYRFILWLLWTFSFLIISPTDNIISAPKKIIQFFSNLRGQ